MLRFTGYILSVPKNSFSTLYGIHQQSRLLLLWLFFSSRFNQCRAADGWTLEEMRMVSLNIYLLDFVPVELQLHADHCLDPKHSLSANRFDAVYQCVPLRAPLFVSWELEMLRVLLSLAPSYCIILCTFDTLTVSHKISLY